MKAVAVLLVAVGIASAAAGGMFALRGVGDVAPQTGVVAAHREVMRSVPTGNRAERRDVRMVEVEIAYRDGDGMEVLTLDRAPEVAVRDLAVGTELPVYVPVDGGVATVVAPGSDPLGLILVGAGGLLAFAGAALGLGFRRAA